MYLVSWKDGAAAVVATLPGPFAWWRTSSTPTTPATASSSTVAIADISTAGCSPRRFGFGGGDCGGAATRLVGAAAARSATVSAAPTPGWPVSAVAKSEQLG